MTVIEKRKNCISKHFDSKCEKAFCATNKTFDAFDLEVSSFWILFEAFWFAVLSWTQHQSCNFSQHKISSDLFKCSIWEIMNFEKLRGPIKLDKVTLCKWSRELSAAGDEGSAHTYTVWESTFIPSLYRNSPPSLLSSLSPSLPLSLASPRFASLSEEPGDGDLCEKVTPNRLSYLGASSLRWWSRRRGVLPRAVLASCTPSDRPAGEGPPSWKSLASFAI